MFAQVLKIFFGKEHLVKNRLISTLDKAIYFKGTIFQGSTKPRTSQKWLEIAEKKLSLFSNMLLPAYIAPRISITADQNILPMTVSKSSFTSVAFIFLPFVRF
jgi:hypothetical protein